MKKIFYSIIMLFLMFLPITLAAGPYLAVQGRVAGVTDGDVEISVSETEITQTFTSAVNNEGIFNVLLKDLNELAIGKDYEMQISAGGKNIKKQFTSSVGFNLFIRGNAEIIGTATINGNVGIGTSSPAEKLHVLGNTKLEGNTEITGTATISGNVGIGTISPTEKLHVVGDTKLDGNTEITGTATINGNVGIGTSAPTAKLHVDGNVKISGNITTNNLLIEEPSSFGNPHFFLSEDIIQLRANVGGPSDEDVSAYVPSYAKGAIIKIILKSGGVANSFLCADINGNYGRVVHYNQNGFSNYVDTWIGGTVFCPFFDEQKFKWKLQSTSGRVYISIIGWF